LSGACEGLIDVQKVWRLHHAVKLLQAFVVREPAARIS
jgi:hypothetical protein